MKLSRWNLALFLMSAAALTGCVSNSQRPENTMRLYSPAVLHLEAGKEIKTLNGIYTPQVDEIWHSHPSYMDRVFESLKK